VDRFRISEAERPPIGLADPRQQLQADGLTVHRVTPRPNHDGQLVAFLEDEGRAEQSLFAAVTLRGIKTGDLPGNRSVDVEGLDATRRGCLLLLLFDPHPARR
jgi:hypothetical protein